MKKPSPWLLVGILGGGLLFVVAVVVSFFLHGNPPPGRAEGAECSRGDECASRECVQGACLTPASKPGGPCDEDADCAGPARCLEGHCLLVDGSACTSAAACGSVRCESGTCMAALAPGVQCRHDTECQHPGECEEGFCRMPDGQKCGGDAQCLSKRCLQGRCQ